MARSDGDSPVARLDAAVEVVRQQLGELRPAVALVLGSGLGGLAESFADAVAIPYRELPHFPVAAVEGHAGRLVAGRLAGVPVVALQGRVHSYEGHDLATVTFPVRVLVRLGAAVLVVTNAAGGIRDDLRPGTLMLIRDHLNLTGGDPLRGPNDERLGPRFVDLTHAYDPALRRLARDAAGAVGVEVAEGVYAGRAGPSYETPAEIEMLHRLGADAVGMSTVPEVIVANHMGARVLGVSLITNRAAGRGADRLSHGDVTVAAARAEGRFAALLTEVVRRSGQTEGAA